MRRSTQELRKQYGSEAVFTRLDDVVIVHLDRPTEAMIRERIAEVQREVRTPEDCPLCEQMRLAGGYEVVYYGSELPEEN